MIRFLQNILQNFFFKPFRYFYVIKVLIITSYYKNYYLETDKGIEEYSDKYISKSPLFIKIAQWLSTREDLTKPFVRNYLQKFQSFAPVDTPEYIDYVIHNDNIICFDDIKNFKINPIASGSIAQVHECEYKGKKCAMKILHQEANLLLIDLKIVTNVFKFMSIFYRQLNTISYQELLDELSEQTDLRKEYINYKNVKQNLKNTPEVYVPDVYCSSDKILVIEWYDGIRFDQLTQDEQYEQRKVMIALFYKMVLKDKVCHGDFHPGNFLFKRRSNHNLEMCVLDYGVTHYIDKKTKKALYYFYKSQSTESKEDLKQFFRTSLQNKLDDNVLENMINDFLEIRNKLKKEKLIGKGNTPKIIKASFDLARKYSQVFSGTVFNIMLQILILHENIDVKDKNYSIFLESVKQMCHSPYYTQQLGYKLKLIKQSLIKNGYE